MAKPINPWIPLLPALFIPFLGSLGYFILFTGPHVAIALYWFSKLFTLAWPILVVLWLEKTRFTLQLGERPNPKQSMLYGFISGLIIVIFLLSMYQFALKGFLVQFSPAIKEKAVELNFLEYYIPFAIFLSLFNAGIEEYYWRWFVYGRLHRFLKGNASYIVAALAFALHHYVVLWQFFGPFVGFLFSIGVAVAGVLWSWLYSRTGTIWGSWISHVLADVAILIIGYKLIFKI